MVAYQQLYMFVGLNFLVIIIGAAVLSALGKLKEFLGILVFVCWVAFSWFYQIRISGHLPNDLYDKHLLLYWFVTIAYSFGVYISTVGIFPIAGISIYLILTREESSKKYGINRSPLPLWLAGLLVGIISTYLLRTSAVPLLNRILDYFTYLIYGVLFSNKVSLPAYYIPVAGIAAGTLVTAIFSSFYSHSKVPFIWFAVMVLVPPLTAVLTPFVDLLGSFLVIILAFAAYLMRDEFLGYKKRPVWPLVTLALLAGILSGIYFYVNGLVVMNGAEYLTIVGGIASGVMILFMTFQTYQCTSNKYRALYFLACIPFITPGFTSAIAFIICLIGSVIVLVLGLSSNHDGEPGERLTMRTSDGDYIYQSGNGRISFSERGQIVDAMEDGTAMDTYYTMDGRKYERHGATLRRVK